MLRHLLFVLSALALSAQTPPVAYGIRTFAGGYSLGDGGPAKDALLYSPEQVAVDPEGNLWIADFGHGRVRKVRPDGTIITAAGNGPTYPVSRTVFEGAPTGVFMEPMSVAVSPSGVVYLADPFMVWRVEPDGKLTRVVGRSAGGSLTEGISALDARFSSIRGFAVSAAGEFYICDRGVHRVFKIDAEGKLRFFAGTGKQGATGDGGPAKDAALYNPQGVAILPGGDVVIADSGNNCLRRVNAQGVIQNYAGAASGTNYGDGPANQVRLSFPYLVATGLDGSLYFSEGDIVRRIGSDSRIVTVAGYREFTAPSQGTTPARKLILKPTGIAVGRDGVLYVSEAINHRVLRIKPNGDLDTFAGADHLAGDGGPASAARFFGPSGFTFDPSGNLYVAEREAERIRRVPSSGNVSTVIHRRGVTSLDPKTTFATPMALAWDPALGLLSGGYGFLQKISAAGQFSLITAGEAGTSAEGTALAQLKLNSLQDARHEEGSLYLVERDAARVSRIGSDGALKVVAGSGRLGSTGDGSDAKLATMRGPTAVTAAGGSVYIADTFGHRVRKVTPDGKIETAAGAGTSLPLASSGDGGQATQASIPYPRGVAVDATGSLFISDGWHRIRRVLPDGSIETVAGNGQEGFSGDGGPALGAMLGLPSKLMALPDGTILVLEETNHRIRQLFPITPALLEKRTGDEQESSAGTAFPLPLIVAVLTADMMPTPNVPLTVTVVEGAADLSSASPKTGPNGTAAVTVTPRAAGPVVVRFEAAGLGEVTFTLMASATAVPVITAGAPPQALVPGSLTEWEIQGGSAAGPAPLTDGVLPLQWGGVCVFVNGQPAPIVALLDSRVAFQAPVELAPGSPAALQLAGRCGMEDEKRSAEFPVEVRESAPRILEVVRIPDSPVVRVYFAGIGLTSPPAVNGRPPAEVLKAALPVNVWVNGAELPAEAIANNGLVPLAEGWSKPNWLGLVIEPAGVGFVEFAWPADTPADAPVTLRIGSAMS